MYLDTSRNVDKECKNVSKCPEKCKCSHGLPVFTICYSNMNESLLPGVVDCRNLGLTKIPEDIPSDTVEL